MPRKILLLVLLYLTLSLSANGAGALFNCDVGGVTFEYLDDETNEWKSGGTFPRLFSVPRYTYICIRVTAPGYEIFEKGYEVTRPDLNKFYISLIPEVSDPVATPLFGIAGQVFSRRGLSILPDTYKIITRNLTTYQKTHAPQISQDIVSNSVDGCFTSVLANLGNNRAAAVGDRIFVGAFNRNMTRCYGYAFVTLKEDNISEAHIMVKILVR
jgi:hypothetical protein